MREQSIHDERVTILFPGALGDLLLALPALRALRAQHGRAHVTLVVGTPLLPLVALAGCADAAVSLDGSALAQVLGGGARPPWLAPGTVLYSWLGAEDAGMRDRLAAGAAGARFFRVERGAGPGHAAVAYARAVGACTDAPVLTETGRVSPPLSAHLAGLRLEEGRPLLAMHIGAGARAKRWAPDGFAAVAAWWQGAGGMVLAILGPAEEGDRPPVGAHEIRDWPLPDVVAVLSRSTLYLGADSGVSHLAGAVGAWGVVLFGPTDPARWRPLGRLCALRASACGPDGIPLEALPAERVIACLNECGRRPDERATPHLPGTSP